MAIIVPEVKSGPVNETVQRRDFIPDGEPFSTREAELVEGFSRDPLSIRPQFVPDKESTPTEPVGDPDKHMAEAAALVKKRSELEAKAEATGKSHVERINALAGKNINETIALIESKNQHDRELWLKAEKQTRGRKGVLKHFGAL